MGSVGSHLSYILTDNAATPPVAAASFAEKMAWLPHSLLPPHQPTPTWETPLPRPHPLCSAGFLFASFSKLFKLTPRLFDTWAGILRRVGARADLLLTRFPADAIPRLRAEAAGRGLPGRRLVAVRLFPGGEHLLHKASLADLVLDTYPYGQHSTATDLLHVGVPLLGGAYDGSAMPARVGLGLLRAAGTTGLLAGSRKGDEDLAVEMAA
jgi:predicted O-linked N-acetylglucosamine transferase (SPINDLY family)